MRRSDTKRGDSRERLAIEPICLDVILASESEVLALEITNEKKDVRVLAWHIQKLNKPEECLATL